MIHFKKMIFAAAVTACPFLLAMPYQARASCSPDPYVGGICWMAADYCPTEYMIADGRILPSDEFVLLSILLGNTYGSAPKGQFRIPDLRGRSVTGSSDHSPLSVRQGEARGSNTITLSQDQIPRHSHEIDPKKFHLSGTVAASTYGSAYSHRPINHYPGVASKPALQPYSDPSSNTKMRENMVTGDLTGLEGATEQTGSGTPINILSPRIALTACIALTGIFPPKN
ncbi:phage tail protein [Thalassospira sp. TSL5-1]|uniref:phage tail protein n=1 Tax=Thalassospira sp. TSL5-1 TaxID=1544451 RepID=UPI00093A2A4A|nr:tail fiber protein [Thalassospira sp. TSL5-1]